jgi:hypothetical protein
MTRSYLVAKLAIEKNISIAVAEKIILEIYKSMTDSRLSGRRALHHNILRFKPPKTCYPPFIEG